MDSPASPSNRPVNSPATQADRPMRKHPAESHTLRVKVVSERETKLKPTSERINTDAILDKHASERANTDAILTKDASERAKTDAILEKHASERVNTVMNTDTKRVLFRRNHADLGETFTIYQVNQLAEYNTVDPKRQVSNLQPTKDINVHDRLQTVKPRSVINPAGIEELPENVQTVVFEATTPATGRVDFCSLQCDVQIIDQQPLLQLSVDVNELYLSGLQKQEDKKQDALILKKCERKLHDVSKTEVLNTFIKFISQLVPYNL